MDKEKICICCGSIFCMRRSDARYCSAACKQKAYKERKQFLNMEESEDPLMEEETDKDEIHTSQKPDRTFFKEKNFSIASNKAEKETKFVPNVNSIQKNSNLRLPFKSSLQDSARDMLKNSEREKSELPDFHRRILYKGHEVPAYWKEIYTKEEFEKLEPEIQENGDVIFSTCHKEKPKDTTSDDLVEKGNALLSKWLRKLLKMVERKRAVAEKLRGIDQEITEFINSFDYRWLMKTYKYRPFLENEFHPRIKTLLSDLKKDDYCHLTIDEKVNEMFNKTYRAVS